MVAFVGMVIGAALRTVLGDAIYNLLFGGSGPDLNGLATAIDTVRHSVEWLGDAFDNVQRREQQALGDLQNQFTLAGQDVAAIGNQLYWCFEWTYNTVIPGSLEWLYTNMDNFLIKPLQHQVAALQAAEKYDRNQIERINNWGQTFVNPTLHQWLDWYKWWLGWPRTTVETVAGWLQYPMKFGEWATPPIANTLIPWLGDGAQTRLLDMLTAEILTAFPADIDTLITVAGVVLETPIPDRLAA
jgi:hypothetical protein